MILLYYATILLALDIFKSSVSVRAIRDNWLVDIHICSARFSSFCSLGRYSYILHLATVFIDLPYTVLFSILF